MSKRRSKGPRPASTYRGARRNQCFRVDGTVWGGVEARYVPYVAKPPILKFGKGIHGAPVVLSVRERKQPKTYKPNGKRECARRRRNLTLAPLPTHREVSAG